MVFNKHVIARKRWIYHVLTGRSIFRLTADRRSLKITHDHAV